MTSVPPCEHAGTESTSTALGSAVFPFHDSPNRLLQRSPNCLREATHKRPSQCYSPSPVGSLQEPPSLPSTILTTLLPCPGVLHAVDRTCPYLMGISSRAPQFNAVVGYGVGLIDSGSEHGVVSYGATDMAPDSRRNV